MHALMVHPLGTGELDDCYDSHASPSSLPRCGAATLKRGGTVEEIRIRRRIK